MTAVGLIVTFVAGLVVGAMAGIVIGFRLTAWVLRVMARGEL